MGSSSGNQWKMEGLQGYTVSFYKDDSSHQQSFQQSERSYNNWENSKCVSSVLKRKAHLFLAPNQKKTLGKICIPFPKNLRKVTFDNT